MERRWVGKGEVRQGQRLVSNLRYLVTSYKVNVTVPESPRLTGSGVLDESRTRCNPGKRYLKP